MKKVGVFWPGDYRASPTSWRCRTLKRPRSSCSKHSRKLGRTPYVVPGFLTRPDEAIEKLGPIDDPLIGVCVHWALWAAHIRRRRRQGQPAPARQQLLRRLAGPRGPAQHRRLPGEPRPPPSPAPGRTPPTGTKTRPSWTASTSGAPPAPIRYPEDEIAYARQPSRAGAMR